MVSFRSVFIGISCVVAFTKVAAHIAHAQGSPPPANPPPAEVLKSNRSKPNADLANQIHQCDLAAAHPFDKHRPGGAGVDFKLIDAPRAIAICEDATAKALDNDYYVDDRGRLSFELGRSYEKSGNAETAQLHYSLAVDDEHYPPAANNLATFYLKGTGGVEQDIPKAVQLIELAANDGFAPAQEALGRWYQDGQNGLPKDPQRAAHLLKLAADQGYADATADLQQASESSPVWPSTPPAIDQRECLREQNHSIFLGAQDVYEDGPLKFRIMSYEYEQSSNTILIGLRSTAPAFNRYIRQGSYNFNLTDTTLCPGKEVSVLCLFDHVEGFRKDYSCTFSQF